MDKPKVGLATTVLHSRVRTGSGEDVGKIEDLVLDPSTDQIQYAVISMDGYPELFIIPWSSFSSSPWPDYVLLNTDKKTLERAPSFSAADWPDAMENRWQQRVREFWTHTPSGMHERTVYVEPNRPPRPRRETSTVAAVALILLLIGVLWGTILVTTRGWEQTRREIAGSFNGAAYAMKEGTQDVALTAKVKTALTLSKRIPASKINVDSQGDVVTLRGEVPSDEIRALAENITRDVPGVREVHNHLYSVKQTQ